MSNLCFQIIPAIQTINIIGDTNDFQKWMTKFHPNKNITDAFEGYRFALNCCLNSFIGDIASDRELGIGNDFLLDCAISQLKPIHLLPNTCEKTIFLKNIKPFIKAVIKSSSFNEISETLTKFNDSVASKFAIIYDRNITISDEIEIDKQTANSLLLIDYAHTFLVQINNNGPTANTHNPLAIEWTKQELKIRYLDGYKYAIQFLWYKLLGEDVFNKTHLSKIHEADSWRKYKIIEKETTGDSLFDHLNETFNLEEQTNFDSYFYWITKEITDSLGKKYNIPVYSIDRYFQFSNSNYNKVKIFGDLLDVSNLKNDTGLSWHDKIEQALYWYSYELVNANKTGMFFGIPSFNTMLAGTVTLHKPKSSEFSKIIAAKFTHPHSKDKTKNDYSYGILIDSQSAAGHYSSGWIIYQNACGDYSGFSGSEHKTSEKLIEEYLKADKIELRELVIPLSEFENYTNQHTKDHRELSIMEENKLIPNIIQKSRAHLFELFTYYICTKFYSKQFNVDFNSDKNSEDGEKDVVLFNDDEVVLIECKLNPQSYDMYEIIEKAEKKLKKYSQVRKSCEFWFWQELSPQNQAILDTEKIEGKSIKAVVVSLPKEEKALKGIYLKQLREIMNEKI